jgi:hypothetical protein
MVLSYQKGVDAGVIQCVYNDTSGDGCGRKKCGKPRFKIPTLRTNFSSISLQRAFE